MSVEPPLLQAVTWSASISLSSQILVWFASWPIAQSGQLDSPFSLAAAVKVNDEMLRFYWSVGEDIEKRQYENRYGSHFYENVSKDLREVLNLNRGMSATTIKYTCYFYRLYSQLFENRQGVIDDFDCIFRIPWSLHFLIIDKFKKEPRKALFFVKKTIENNWGYAVLLICRRGIPSWPVMRCQQSADSRGN